MISVADIAQKGTIGLTGSLKKLEATKRPETRPTGLQETGEALILAHDSRVHRYGLLGSLLGAVFGTIVQPHLPCRELMFTIIVPISTTYSAFGIGCLIAMGVTKMKSLGISVSHIDQSMRVLDRKDPHSAELLTISTALAAAMLGAYWGWVGCPDFVAPAPSVFISRVMAAISGAVFSLVMGIHIGSIMRLDSAPKADC
jgi:sulfite exporter TauE/SafE